MRRCAFQAVLLLGVVGLQAAPSVAFADDTSSDLDKRFEQMQKELENLRNDNANMKSEIGRLQTKVGEEWMTEQRADEVRGIVADMLADADSRSSLLQGTQFAGWNEHFFLASPDGRFKLQLEGQIQFRWVLGHRKDNFDGWRYGFENTRTKLTFRGHIFSPDTTYLVRGNFSREQFAQEAGPSGPPLAPGGASDKGGIFQLQDAWVQQQINHEWSVRAGQFKLPFTREELVSSQYQLMVERSLINISENLGRSQGVEFDYFGDILSFSFAISDGGHDQIGGFGTIVGTIPENTPALTPLAEWAFTSRVQWLAAGSWDQFVDFTSPPGEQFGLMLGLAGHIQRNQYGNVAAVRDEEYWSAFTVDLSIEWGGVNAFIAYTQHYVDSAAVGILDVFGVVAQAGVYVTPKLELVGRFEYGRVALDTGFNFSNLYLITVGANYYIDGHDLKLSADVGFAISQVENVWDADIAGWQLDAPGNEPQMVIRTQIQFLF